jgi:hypothetical protein
VVVRFFEFRIKFNLGGRPVLGRAQRPLVAHSDNAIPKTLGRFERKTRPGTSRRLSLPVDPNPSSER